MRSCSPRMYDILQCRCASAPTSITSEADADGQLWGWEAGTECAYKTADNAPQQLLAAEQLQQDGPAVSAAAESNMVARVGRTSGWLPPYLS